MIRHDNDGLLNHKFPFLVFVSCDFAFVQEIPEGVVRIVVIGGGRGGGHGGGKWERDDGLDGLCSIEMVSFFEVVVVVVVAFVVRCRRRDRVYITLIGPDADVAGVNPTYFIHALPVRCFL